VETQAAEQLVVDDVATKSREFLEDRIARLDWRQMQELVAEILRAMGYRARVASDGPDRGVDIIASPDGLGLQEPRIFVEVKHRPGTQIGSDLVRSFIGGRRPGDRCLYVSTGGFSKDARYEAERASVPLTLITLPELRELLTEYYDRFSPSGAALIPLERVYWPKS
jgi:restriction system protein